MPIKNLESKEALILCLKDSLLQIGEEVGEGQALVQDKGTNLIVHSPVAGTVDNIVVCGGEKYYYIKKNPNIPPKNYPIQNPLKKHPMALIEHLRLYGVEDRGSPMWHILKKAVKKIQTIVINAVEPEPFLCADTRIFLEHTKEVLLGAEYIRYVTSAKEIVIIISKKSKLSKYLQEVTKNLNRFIIKEVSNNYPKAYDQFIIESVFGSKSKNKTKNKIPNIETFSPAGLLAVTQALLFNRPHTTTIVSVDGSFCAQHGNFRIPIGMSLYHFLRPYSSPESYTIVNGGPFSGVPGDFRKGVGKKTKALLVFSPVKTPESSSCIECGLCLAACPVELSPWRLYDMIEHKEIEKAKILGADKCISCNACSYVCPSFIPLGSKIFSISGANNGSF